MTARLPLAAALTAVLAVAALPAAAQAVTVDVGGGVLRVNEARTGERNDVRVTPLDGEVLIRDSAGVRGAAPCRDAAGGLVCPPGTVQAFLGAGDDRMEYRLPEDGFAHLGDGGDTVLGGLREAAGRLVRPFSYIGGPGRDTLDYGRATAGVTVDMTGNGPSDGRPGDREDVLGEFEALIGTPFRDTLLGTPAADRITAGRERDVVAGGAGDDVFPSHERDGADDYHGGPGSDAIEFLGRTAPLAVSLDDAPNDGEALELDNVRANVEHVFGGSGADTLVSLGASSRLEGRGGRDTLLGGDGPDTLVGGPGADDLQAGAGHDAIGARDGEPDTTDCGTGADSLTRDATEGATRGCESAQVGVLRLADRTLAARAGEPVTVALRWRHPRAWRALRAITVRVLRDGVPVGAVRIAARSGRLRADGIARPVRSATRVTRAGRTVSARLALRLDAAGGERLGLEIEAADRRGRRQLESGAGRIRVTR